MENTALVLIIVTLFFLVIILGLLVILLYKIFDKKSGLLGPIKDEVQNFHPEIVNRMKEAKVIKKDRRGVFCLNHPQEPGEVMCSICDTLFCSSCIKPFKTLYFCKEHLPLIMQNDWEEALTLKTSTEDPEEGVRLYDLKKEIFINDKIPSYVETHYKINVDHDFIETYLVLFGMKQDIEALKQKIQLK